MSSFRYIEADYIQGANAGRNYIRNSHARVTALGGVAYADAAAASPVDGTGGSPTLALSRVTSSPLMGDAMFRITKDANSRQGEGIGWAFTIDAKDQAKTLQVAFDYKPSSAYVTGTDSTDSDLRVFIYDVTNAILIPVSPSKIVGGSSVYSQFSGIFQTAYNSTSYRLIIHVATTNASAWTFDLVNLFVGAQQKSFGTPITDWTTFTPTGSWSANTTYTGRWARVGDSMDVDIQLSLAGAPTSATLTINLPAGYSIDTSKLASGTSDSTPLGDGTYYDANGSPGHGQIWYQNTTSVLAMYTINNDGSNRQTYQVGVTQAAPFTFASGDRVSVRFKVPILGWSSSVLMSSDADTRVVAMGATTAAAGSIAIGTGVPFNMDATGWDTHGRYTSPTYTVPVAGYYRCHGTVATNVAQADIRINVNGVDATRAGWGNDQGECTFSGTVKVKVGDVIKITCASIITVGDGTLYIERVSGPSQIAASEKVAFKGYGMTTSITTSDTALIFASKTYDTHGAYNVSTGVFTCPENGFYAIRCFMGSSSTPTGTANTAHLLAIWRNGSQENIIGQFIRQISGALSINLAGSDLLYCKAGDTLQFYANRPAGDSANWTTSGSVNSWCSIERVG